LLLTGSWDWKQRVYDDNDPDEKQGKLREPEVDRHSGPINFIDLDCRNSLAASASEDGTIALVNHWSHKLEGRLNPKDEHDPPSVSICKFLKNPDYANNPFNSSFVLVTADLDGYLNFYALDGILKN